MEQSMGKGSTRVVALTYGVTVRAPVQPGKRARHMGKRLEAQVDGTRWRGSTLAALQYLARKADETTCIVRGEGLQDIADALGGLSWKRTKTIMQALRNGGVVETIKRGGGRQKNTYRLHLTPDNNDPGTS